MVGLWYLAPVWLVLIVAGLLVCGVAVLLEKRDIPDERRDITEI